MPTNLPAEAQAAWQKYLSAKSLEDKIKALEEYISLIPKHKGTEKLLMQVKKTLTKLKLELSKKREIRKKTAIHPAFSIPKNEDAQLTLLGLPGTGKTALFNYLTNNNVPFGKTTLLPNVGIFRFQGAVFQVIDLPPVFSENIDETPNGRSILSLVRNSDLILLIIDLSQDIDWQFNTLINLLKKSRIIIDRSPPPIKFIRLSRGGIQIHGANYTPFSLDELKDLIKSLGILNCILEINGNVDEEDILNALDKRTVFKKSIIIATKADIQDAHEKLRSLAKLAKNLRIISSSALAKIGKMELGQAVLSELNLIRVWTRKNGKIAERALVLPKGATVRDAAEKIHTDFVRKFKYAIVERPGSKIKRLRVGLNFELEEGDILMIHVSD